MKDTPFGRVTRSARWLRFAFFGLLPVLLLLLVGLYWGVNRYLHEQRQQLDIDFALMMGYVEKHEGFLQLLNRHSARLQAPPPASRALLREVPMRGRSGVRHWLGQEDDVHLAFSLVCAEPDCAAARQRMPLMGEYVAEAYSGWWARSGFPAGEVFAVDAASRTALSVPGIDAASGFAPLTQDQFEAVETRVRQYLAQGTPPGGSGAKVAWLRSPQLPDRMIGVIATAVPADYWQDGGSGMATPPDLYAATLLNLGRIAVLEHQRRTPLYDDFWLARRDGGVLDGHGTPPVAPRIGINHTAGGWVFHYRDASGEWDAYYRVGYAGLIRNNPWLLPGAVLLMLLGIGGAMGFARWYDRRVVAPALVAQRDLLESEAFNRTIVDTTPVALCVLDRASGRLLFGNQRARQWLGLPDDAAEADSERLRHLRTALAGVDAMGVLETFAAHDGRELHVAYTPSRYRHRDVILCAFTDISAHAEIERRLAQAKRDADQASAAKSTFLATMSHEIRTPLYGVLGTLELLELTPLNPEQRGHLATLQHSSDILLQLISDILDTTRIETGQMVLESEGFSPRHLVEDTVAAYAAMAGQKSLLLFACVDPDVPARLRGDPGRIRQILANLVSNAIKFTEAGHVMVRLDTTGGDDGKAMIRLEVADTGIGIDAEHRARLFEPFHQIDAGEHAIRGAGLGLSICMQLARLMDSRIEVDSEAGAGSRFWLDLALAREADADASPDPMLAGARVQVRAAHPALADNCCRWLRRWGGEARLADSPPRAASPDDVLLDILLAEPAPPPEWKGRHVVAGNTPVASPSTAADAHHLDRIAQAIVTLLGGGTTPEAKPDSGTLPDPLRLNVLVAEDNPINRATLAHQLALLGCTVTTAVDGVEALAHWHGPAHFDVLLTDVNMPRLDGYALARAVRAEDADVRIIGVTANAMREEERKCRDAGMNSWLVKPIGLRTLYRHLRGEPAKAAAPPTGNDDVGDAGLPLPYTGLFDEVMRADVARVREALAAGRPGEVITTLHRMRGAMAMLQMTTLMARFEQLEDRIRAEGIVADVGDQVESVLHALEIELMKLG